MAQIIDYETFLRKRTHVELTKILSAYKNIPPEKVNKDTIIKGDAVKNILEKMYESPYTLTPQMKASWIRHVKLFNVAEDIIFLELVKEMYKTMCPT